MVSFMKGSYIKISFRMIVKLPVVYLLFFFLCHFMEMIPLRSVILSCCSELVIQCCINTFWQYNFICCLDFCIKASGWRISPSAGYLCNYKWNKSILGQNVSDLRGSGRDSSSTSIQFSLIQFYFDSSKSWQLPESLIWMLSTPSRTQPAVL